MNFNDDLNNKSEMNEILMNYEDEEDSQGQDRDEADNENELKINNNENKNLEKDSQESNDSSSNVYNSHASNDAEINSLYITPNDQNSTNIMTHNETHNGSKTEESDEDMDNVNSLYHDDVNKSNNSNNKRRKPHNPQKLSQKSEKIINTNNTNSEIDQD